MTEALLILFRAIYNMAQANIMALFGLFTILKRLAYTSVVLCRAPSMLLHDNIRIEDALGRSWSLPYQQFRHLEVLRSMLQCEFKGCPGEAMVRQGRYDLFERSSGERIINKSGLVIAPGSSLSMSVMLWPRPWASWTCPRCDHHSSSCSIGSWIKW